MLLMLCFVCFQKHFFDPKSGGPLLNRYNNQLRYYRKELGLSYKNKKSSLKKVANDDESAEYSTSKDEQELLLKVNCFYEPWVVFKSDWDQLYNLRMYDSKELLYEEFVKKYPILTNGKIALHLVSSHLLLIKKILIWFCLFLDCCGL